MTFLGKPLARFAGNIRIPRRDNLTRRRHFARLCISAAKRTLIVPPVQPARMTRLHFLGTGARNMDTTRAFALFRLCGMADGRMMARAMAAGKEIVHRYRACPGRLFLTIGCFK